MRIGIDEQEQEHRDRRPETKVVDAAEGRPPHGKRDHVGVVLDRSRRDRDDDVEDLEDVDQHRHEDDREHGREERDGDPSEDLPFARAVRTRGLERSRGIAASPAAITTIEKPAQTQMYAIMIAGVMSLGRATTHRRTAPRTCSLRSLCDTRPASTSSKAKVPFASVCVDATRAPPSSRSSTVIPGSPTSSCSSSPGVPPPGLKSPRPRP